MLRTIIISPNSETGAHLAAVLRSLVADVELVRVVDRYLTGEELSRVVRAHAPQVILLGFDNPGFAVETVRLLESEAAGIQVIATHGTCEPALLRESMRAGIREFLSEPFDLASVTEALRNVQALIEKKPPTYPTADQILSFLPAKAGVGATTLALNISAAMARNKENRVLLTDFDLNSGMLRFLLQLYPEYSVVDAVENVSHLDETIWPQLITSRFGMDLLHSGRINPNLRIDPAQVTSLLEFMRRNYDSLVFDLSGNLERYSLEVMQESRHVFLVCTPEIASLHLAREKMTFLRSVSLESKVSIILNRVSKRPLFTVDQVEELVGAKVLSSFSNDYYAVNRATTAAECLAPDSVIGGQCADFVRQLTSSQRAGRTGERKKKFLEFFALGSQPMVAAD